MSGAREASRIVLRFDPILDQDNTWRLISSSDGVEVRVRIGGISYTSKVYLRWRQLPSGVDLGVAAKRVFVAPADAELTVWVVQPCVVSEGLLPVELQLERAPEHVTTIMESW